MWGLGQAKWGLGQALWGQGQALWGQSQAIWGLGPGSEGPDPGSESPEPACERSRPGWRRKCPVFLVQFIFFPVTCFTITNYPRKKMSSFFLSSHFFSHQRKCPVPWQMSSFFLKNVKFFSFHFAFRILRSLLSETEIFLFSHFALRANGFPWYLLNTILLFALRTSHNLILKRKISWITIFAFRISHFLYDTNISKSQTSFVRIAKCELQKKKVLRDHFNMKTANCELRSVIFLWKNSLFLEFATQTEQ